MSTLPPAGVFSVSRVEARRSDRAWTFARDQSARIAAHWAALKASKPALFDGRVLLQCEAALSEGVFRATYLETDYSAFLAWRDWDAPDRTIRNGFAMAALCASDGAFLCGRMGQHTANAGSVYFPAGTPDPGDVTADGTVDLAGSALRELCEETGLTPAEIRAGDGFAVVIEQQRVAFMRDVQLDLPAVAARSLMMQRIAALHEEELDDIVIVRSMADAVQHRMPDFMLAFFRHAFAA